MSTPISMLPRLDVLAALKEASLQARQRKKLPKSTAAKADDRRKTPIQKGDVFGSLTVLDSLSVKRGRSRYYSVRCDCGTCKFVRVDHLRDESVLSCGCTRHERHRQFMTEHGHYTGNRASKLRQAWNSMVGRCYRPANPSFNHYSRKGIVVCARWLDGENGKSAFECFESDMGVPPSPLHSLDRWPDNTGNYSPDNCRWATAKEQANNTSTNRTLTCDGRKQTLAQWTLETGLSYGQLVHRLKGCNNIDTATLAEWIRTKPNARIKKKTNKGKPSHGES